MATVRIVANPVMKLAITYTARTVSHAPTTKTSVNDVNARTLAVITNVRKILSVLSICAQIPVETHRLWQFVVKVRYWASN